jgi:hypothetical protein
MPTVEERLAYLEGRAGDQASALTDMHSELHETRMELRDLRAETNTGFVSLRNAMDARFTAIDARFAAADSKVTWLIGIQVGMLLMIASAALGAFFR